MIPQCQDCSSRNIEYIDASTGEFIPDWLVDARGIKNWDTDCEPALLRWQENEGYTDQEMQNSVDGVINSERLSGDKPKGYLSVSKAIQRRLRMKYDEPQQGRRQQNTSRYPAKGHTY